MSTITNAVKLLDGTYRAEFDGVTMFIPNSMDNRHRQALDEWEKAGNTIAPASPDPELIPDISDRQFFQQLAVEGRVSEAEALAAVATGTIPAAMLALINQLPADQRFNAKMLVSGATTFRRAHPVSELIRQLYSWTPAQADKFWKDAYLL